MRRSEFVRFLFEVMPDRYLTKEECSDLLQKIQDEGMMPPEVYSVKWGTCDNIWEVEDEK